MARADHRTFYTDEAKCYEATRYGSRYGRIFRVLQRAAVEQSLESTHRILDVATGTGQMLPVLASSAKVVVASDLTPAMLRVAKQQLPGDERIQFCVSDAMRLPYGNGAFDVVASSRFLHLFEPAVQLALVREMSRVLCHGGELIVDFYGADARRAFGIPVALYRSLLRKRAENDFRVSIREACAMMKECGLRVCRVQGLGNFLLVPFLWLPLPWLASVGTWLGRAWPRLSEQFLIVARKP